MLQSLWIMVVVLFSYWLQIFWLYDVSQSKWCLWGSCVYTGFFYVGSDENLSNWVAVLCRIVGVWLPSTFYSLNLIFLEILLQIIGLDFWCPLVTIGNPWYFWVCGKLANCFDCFFYGNNLRKLSLSSHIQINSKCLMTYFPIVFW